MDYEYRKKIEGEQWMKTTEEQAKKELSTYYVWEECLEAMSHCKTKDTPWVEYRLVK